MTCDPQLEAMFNTLVHWKLGDGATIRFWQDRWIAGRCVADLAPLVLEKVSDRCVLSRSVNEALVDNRWVTDISGGLSTAGLVVHLWDAIMAEQPTPNERDKPIWPWNAEGHCSASSTYHMLWEGNVHATCAKPLWNSWAPLNCKIFIWLALKYCIWTSDRRLRRGLQDEVDICYLCDQDVDTTDHILMSYVYAREVWYRCFELLKIIQWTNIPSLNDTLENWWLRSRDTLPRINRKGFDSLVMLICWSLWKQRNARVFNNFPLQKNVLQLSGMIIAELKLWKMA